MNILLKKALPAGLFAALLAMVPFGDAIAHGRDRDRDRHHHHHHYDRDRDRGRDWHHHHHHHYHRPPPPPVHYHHYGYRPAPPPPATVIYQDYYRGYVPSNSFMLNVQIDGRR